METAIPLKKLFQVLRGWVIITSTFLHGACTVKLFMGKLITVSLKARVFVTSSPSQRNQKRLELTRVEPLAELLSNDSLPALPTNIRLEWK